MGRYIHTADIHLEKAIPACRTETQEEWLELQKKSLIALKDYAIEYDATLLMVGDIFDNAIASVTMVNMFLEVFLPIADRVMISTGNHCLRGHNYANVDESSYGILRNSFKEIPSLGEDSEIGGFHFNQAYDGKHKVLCTHQLTFDSDKECETIGSGKTAQTLLTEFPHAEFILTGDMHTKFVYEANGRVVINPGCVTRRTTKYVDYTPSCYFLDTETREIEELPLPDWEAELSTGHRDNMKAKEERFEAFISIVRGTGVMSLNFVENLENITDKKLSDILKEVYGDVSIEDAMALLKEVISNLKMEVMNE